MALSITIHVLLDGSTISMQLIEHHSIGSQIDVEPCRHPLLQAVARIPLKVKREVDEWDVEETQYVPILQEGLRRMEKVRINVTARVRYICAEQVGASPF